MKFGFRNLHVIYVPRHVHARVAIHSMATATGLAFAFRMGSGAPIWTGVAWYFGSFIGFHVVLMPFMAAWYMISDRFERWVRSIVEEELIRFDMRGYERQLHRLLPLVGRPPDEPPPD